MKKRILSLVLCITMLTGVLVGCGGNSSSENTEQNTQQNTEQNTQLSTEQNSEVVEEVKYYSVSEEDLEHSLYKVWDLLAQYRKALRAKEVYGEFPNTPKKFMMGCTSNKGNLTILQESNRDIIFTENYVNDKEHDIYADGYYDLFNMIDDEVIASPEVAVFIDIEAKNFEGNFIYKEGTKQVIKVVMDFFVYNSRYNFVTERGDDDNKYHYLFVVYLTKEAGNSDVWLIDDMKYYAPQRDEGGHWNIDDSRYLDSVLAQEDFTLLVNEDSDNIDVGNTGYNAYIEYIKSEFSDYLDAYYNMADFDGDGFKEVIYDGDYGKYLLAYYDGKVIKSELPAYGYLLYKPNENTLVHYNDGRGFEDTTYFHLEKGKLVVDLNVSCMFNSDGDKAYLLNDENITKEEYEKYYINIYAESIDWTYLTDIRYYNEIVSELSK